MKEAVSNCGRESELISFLYGELNDVEAQTFQRHVRECAACNGELAAFGDVRGAVVAWRNESLGAIVSPAAFTNQVSDQKTNVAGKTARNDQSPSALSALREFFNLSPLWLKGAVAFASLLFCLFAGLAIARLREQPPVVVAGSAAPTPSQAEINALVEQRVQAELQRIRNATGQQEKAVLTADNSASKNTIKRGGGRSEVAETNQKARRPLSKTEREQLAADLRLTSGKNDGELDLLDDRINQ